MAEQFGVKGELSLGTGGVKKGVSDAKAELRSFVNEVSGVSTRATQLLGNSVAVGLAAALGTAAGAAAILHRRIDDLDNINKLNQRTGLSTEALTKFGYAARLADVDLQTLAGGMRFLNKAIVEAQDPTSKMAGLFKRLGIDAGSGLESVLLQTSSAFKRVKDESQRSALAVEFFSKSGTQLIPFLLSDLKKLGNEAERFRLVVGKDATQAAEDFNDNLSRARASATGLATAVTSNLLKSLVPLSEGFAKAFDDPDRIDRYTKNITRAAEATLGVVGAVLKVIDVIDRAGSAGSGLVERLQLNAEKNAYSKNTADLQLAASLGDVDAKNILKQRLGPTGPATVTPPSEYTYTTPGGQFVGPELPGLDPGLGGSKGKGKTAAELRAASLASAADVADAKYSALGNTLDRELEAAKAMGATFGEIAEIRDRQESQIEAGLLERYNAQVAAINSKADADKEGEAAATRQNELVKAKIEYDDQLEAQRSKNSLAARADLSDQRKIESEIAITRATTLLDSARADVEIAQSRAALVEDEFHSVDEIQSARSEVLRLVERERDAQVAVLEAQRDQVLASGLLTQDAQSRAKAYEDAANNLQRVGSAQDDVEKKRQQDARRRDPLSRQSIVGAGVDAAFSTLRGLRPGASLSEAGTAFAGTAGQYLTQNFIAPLVASAATGTAAPGGTAAASYAAAIIALIGAISGAVSKKNEIERGIEKRTYGDTISTGAYRQQIEQAAIGGSIEPFLGKGVGSGIGKLLSSKIGSTTQALMTGGLSKVLLLAFSAPTVEKQLAKQLEKMFSEAGLLNAEGLVQTRSPGELSRGQGTVQQLGGGLGSLSGPLSSLGRVLFGTKDFANTRFANAFLNSRQQLGLNKDESLRELDKLASKLGVTLPNALQKLNDELIYGNIAQQDYLKTATDLVTLLGRNIGPGVDTQALLEGTIGANGRVDVQAFLRAAETSIATASAGFGGALANALKDGAATSGEEIGQAFGDSLIQRAVERLASAPAQQFLTKAATELDQAVAAKIGGNQGEYERLKSQGLADFAIGRANATDYLNSILPDIQSLVSGVSGGAARGVFGLPSFDVGGVANWPMGQPGLAVLHGGETVATPGDMRDVVSLLRNIAGARNGQPVAVTVNIGPTQVQQAMDYASTVQLTGSPFPADVGVA